MNNDDSFSTKIETHFSAYVKSLSTSLTPEQIRCILLLHDEELKHTFEEGYEYCKHY